MFDVIKRQILVIIKCYLLCQIIIKIKNCKWCWKFVPLV